MALPLCGRAGRENDIFKTIVAYFLTLVISLSSRVWLCKNSVFAVILTQYLDHGPIKAAHGCDQTRVDFSDETLFAI